MEQLIHDERLRDAEVLPVRIDDVTNCYSTLRDMDSRGDARSNKYIVLDLSSDDALRRILKQVPETTSGALNNFRLTDLVAGRDTTGARRRLCDHLVR